MSKYSSKAPRDPLLGQINNYLGKVGLNLFDELKELAEIRDAALDVLQVGCEDGSALEDLVNSGRFKINGVGVEDPVPTIKNPTAEYLLGDATDLPIPDDSVDFGFDFNGLKETTDPLKALEEAIRVLKEGGKFIWYFASEEMAADRSTPLGLALKGVPGFNLKRSLYSPEHTAITCVKDDSFEGFGHKAVQVNGTWSYVPKELMLS